MGIRHWGAVALAFGIGAFAVRSAEAAFVFTIVEQGNDVVVTGSGTLDLTGLTLSSAGGSGGGTLRPQIGFVGLSGTTDLYAGVSGPASFGPGTPFPGFPVETGDAVAIRGSVGDLWVPAGYVSGNPLSSTAIYANRSFATIGLTPGTYVWTWRTDSLTVEIIESVGVPEPATALLLGAGLLGLAAARRRAKREA